MFDSQLSIRAASATTWELTAPLIWTGTQGDTFTVPTGFVTDFASVPRVLRWLINPYDTYTRAAVLHDYLIVHLINHPEPTLRVSSRDTDGIFRRVMHDLGTPWLTRWLMWTAVRWASLGNPRRARGRGIGADLPALLGMSALGLLVMLPAVVLPGALGIPATLGLVRLAGLITGAPRVRRRTPTARRDAAHTEGNEP